MLALVALVASLGAVSTAAADDCVGLGGVINAALECEITNLVAGVKTGTFTIAETLHFTDGGQVKVGASGIAVNITAGDFIMDANTLLDGNVTGCNTGAAIAVALTGGNVTLEPLSVVRSNSCSGGFIQITTSTRGIVNIDGLVESVGSMTGTGASQKPGGGPITIKAGCALVVGDDGVVSSRGLDPGADLVHLEGCTVVVDGLVESTGSGHGAPNTPANSCSNAATSQLRRNPVTRPGKPLTSTGCVEIWSGTTIVVDSTGTHGGEVKADIGVTGGSQGRGWIDLLANGTITIHDGTGNDGAAAVFAVHANGSTMQNTDNGGLILIQTYNGSVVATGNAVQADALTSGSSGGEIRIEAKNNVTLDTAAIVARGDFIASGGFGSGGMIGPLAPTVPPPGQAPIRAFLGALSWQNGVGDVRPTGAGVTAAGQRGQINLQACTGVNTASSTFPVLGAIVGTYPNVLGAACAGAPIVPAYVTGFPAATCESLCTLPGGGKKSGIKFNDVAGDGVKDPTDPPLADWEMRVYQGTTFIASQLTDALGKYEFTLLPSTYVVCEVLQPSWTQTFPTVGGNVVSCAGLDNTVTLAPLGYQFTVTNGSNEINNDFGNYIGPLAGTCPEDPTARLTRAVDAAGLAHGGTPVYLTVQAAYNASTNGDVIGIFSNTIENVVLDGDKTLEITQCTAARVTAAVANLPVWKLTGIGKLTIIGPDAAGGTIGWSLDTGGHELRAVRATGASLFGIQIGQNSFGNSVSFNSVTASPVGVQIDGDSNIVRGGTVSGSSGDGVVIGSTGSNNTFSGANVQNNAGNGIVVNGSTNNTVKDNNRVDSNGLTGILVNGNGNIIKNNQAASDKAKGNGGDGFKIVGTGNTLESNKANANVGNGFYVTGTATGTKLKSNQSNTENAGDSKENGGFEFKLDVGATNQGGNKADTIAIPKTSVPQKCPTFPQVGTCE
jgi:Right handed beta helix region